MFYIIKGLRLIYLENILHSPLISIKMIEYLIKLHFNHKLELFVFKYDLLLYHTISGHILQNEEPTFSLV